MTRKPATCGAGSGRNLGGTSGPVRYRGKPSELARTVPVSRVESAPWTERPAKLSPEG